MNSHWEPASNQSCREQDNIKERRERKKLERNTERARGLDAGCHLQGLVLAISGGRNWAGHMLCDRQELVSSVPSELSVLLHLLSCETGRSILRQCWPTWKMIICVGHTESTRVGRQLPSQELKGNVHPLAHL